MPAKILILLFACCLAGCSVTRIHLFKQGIDDAEFARITNNLTSNGYRVIPNSLRPPEFDSPTLIYSPAHRDFESIKKLLVVLSDLGYEDIDPVAAFKDNHSYSRTNVGVYLGYPESPDTALSIPLFPTYFEGKCGKREAYLSLSPDGSSSFEVIEDEVIDRVTKIVSAWERNKNSIYLFWEGETFRLRIEERRYQDQYGKREKTRLVGSNANANLGHCEFFHSVIRDVQ
jgi:hypothetical protein